MSDKPNQKNGFFTNFLESLSGKSARIKNEKARLEAFLSAVPGEYCGWTSDGTVAYSKGFAEILSVESIASIHDIQNALGPSDGAALETMINRLEDNQSPFIFKATNFKEDKIFQISGSHGVAPCGSESFTILWIKDTTNREHQFRTLEKAREAGENEIMRLQNALDIIPHPIWIRNQISKITWVNKTYADSLSMTPADIIEEQKELPISSSRKNKQRSATEMAKQAIRTGQEQDEKLHLIVGGQRCLYKISETPLTHKGITIGSAQDITKEEELETEFSRFAAANHEMLEQLRTAVAIFDADQRIEFYNSAYAQLWDLQDSWLNTKPKLGEIMEKLRDDRRLPEQADFRSFKKSWLSMFKDLLKPTEDMLYLPDMTALRMLIVPHSMGGLIMTFEDVTSRLELESSYNTLVAVQKETLDNLAEAVSVYGADGRLKLWNPSFLNLWHFNPEDVDTDPHISRLGSRMSLLFKETTQETMRNELIAQAITREELNGRMKRLDSTLIDYATTPLPDGGVLVTHMDVTDSVRVENALREKNAALETAERLKLEFLANVSYQLRTPLNSIMGFSEILSAEYFGKLNDKQKEYAHDISDAGQRLLSLIDDILDLSTIEAGYLELKTELFSTYDMLESLQEVVVDWGRKKKIEIDLQCPKNISKIEADQRRIKQVLLNLITNAITFTPEGGNITIGARRSKLAGNVELYIKDTGTGINQEDQEKIFEPFEKSTNQMEKEERGAGLGLSLVKNITELHGGFISLESEMGKGSTFSLNLPVKQP